MARIISVAVLALGLTLTALVGCESQSQKWYGDWEGDLQRADPIPGNDVVTTINKVRLTILPNGTFELLRSGINESGTHRLGKDRAFLTITHVLGRPVGQLGTGAEKMNKDLTAVWQSDGSVLLSDPGGFDERPVRLTRREQPPK